MGSGVWGSSTALEWLSGHKYQPGDSAASPPSQSWEQPCPRLFTRLQGAGQLVLGTEPPATA